MTTEFYCKTVAEVDNSLVTDRSRLGRKDIEDLFDDRSTNGDTKPSLSIMYPNGWLPLMESHKVSKGEIKRAMILGRDVIVSRSLEGEISVLDAYCPHMGVHIGIGGKVVEINKESCVQCPFHGWTFSSKTGQCVNIPYLTKRRQGENHLDSNNGTQVIPKQAKLKAWTSCEIDNFIYIWHHVDNMEPSWFLEPTPELNAEGAKRWKLVGRSCHKSNLDASDMLENGADMHHFEGIHNDLFLFGGDLVRVKLFSFLQKYFKHCWNPDWRPILDEENRMTHKAEVRLDSWIKFFGLDLFYIEVRAIQVGPARVVLRYRSNWYGPGIITMNAIRLGGRQTLYVQHVYTEDIMFNRMMAKCVLYGEVKQVS